MVSHTVFEARRFIIQLLDRHGIEDADFEAYCLLECATGKSRQWLLLNKEHRLTADEQSSLKKLANRRISGEPLQYLLGKWEFFGLEFEVGKGVLIPRSDTEILCELAISKLDNKCRVVADLCSGTGCVGITVEAKCPNARVICVELSDKALPYLKRNIAKHGSMARLIEGDALDPKTAAAVGKLDMLLCNPPYLTKKDMDKLRTEVRHEPEMALYGQEDGLGFYREITRLWAPVLVRGGWLAYEIGIGQETDVKRILLENGFTSVGAEKDYNGIYRVIYGTKE